MFCVFIDDGVRVRVGPWRWFKFSVMVRRWPYPKIPPQYVLWVEAKFRQTSHRDWELPGTAGVRRNAWNVSQMNQGTVDKASKVSKATCIRTYISTSVIWSHHKINIVLRRTAQKSSTKGMSYRYPSQHWFQSWTFSSHPECHRWGYVIRERLKSACVRYHTWLRH